MATFTPQLVMPAAGDPYYNTIKTGGYNPCILGNPQRREKTLNVLPNCVGYATGRFNEIIGSGNCKYLGNTNAANFVDLARRQGLLISQTPTKGGCMVWKGGKTGEGHVAIVELMMGSRIVTSESEYYGKAFTIYQRFGKNWSDGCYWMNSSYTFLGCIVNPAIQDEEKHKVTYEEFCAFMARWLDELKNKPASAWAVPFIEFCIENGLMVGDDEEHSFETFRPLDPVKREEMAAILTTIFDRLLLTDR